MISLYIHSLSQAWQSSYHQLQAYNAKASMCTQCVTYRIIATFFIFTLSCYLHISPSWAEENQVSDQQLQQLQQQLKQLQQQLAFKPKDPGAYKTPLSIKYC